MSEEDDKFDTSFVSCATSLVDCTIININVSGKIYQTYDATLRRYPETLLGSPAIREAYYDRIKGEYFFDRHRSCFTAILYYYQSEGMLIRPVNLSPDVFMQECSFFGLGEEAHKLLGFDKLEVSVCRGGERGFNDIKDLMR